MTILEVLLRPKDTADALAARALRLMLRAKAVSRQATVDGPIAWLFASAALRLISEHLKHYPFLPQEPNGGWRPGVSGWPIEQSGSMRREPLSEATVIALSSTFLDKADDLLQNHQEPPGITDKADFFPDAENHAGVQPAYERILLMLADHSSLDWSRYCIVVGEPTDTAGHMVHVPALNQGYANLVKATHVSSLADLPQAIRQLIQTAPR